MWSLLSAGICIALAQGVDSQSETGAAACAEGKIAALRAMWDDPGAAPPDGGIADFSTDTDVLSYFLDIEILPSTSTITGSCTMTVKSNVNNLTAFQVRIRDNFTLTSVQVNGVTASYSRIDVPTIQIALSPAKSAGEQFTVYVAYTGVPVSRGFGSINFTTQGGSSLVFTLSEPYYAYTWWPAKDDNRDKATGDMWFTVPSSLVVASNGTLQGTDTLSGSRKRYRWKTVNQTAVYLYSFAATNYNKYTQTYDYGTGTMPVDIYLYPADDNATNRNAWFKSVTMLGTFGTKYGLYPFVNEKYGIYEFEFGGGMEHQTMTGQGTTSESVTAHELSHQWWGDNVTCATWSDIWLNEGFADYSEAIWEENKPGSSGKAALLAAMAARRPSSVGDSVYCYDTTDINRIFSTNYTYLKGGWVLHMLRHVVGDTHFFDILAAYRAAYQQGSATTADFQAVAESIYGSSLAWFFDPWVYDIGAPAYQYAWRQVTAGGKNWVELYVKQVQSASYPLFPMPIDIVTTISGNNTTNVVWNDAAAEHLLFQTTAPISSLSFDPEKWILWTGATTTTFAEGPPKIVATTPAPNATVPTGNAGDPLTVVFHKNVNINSSQVTLVGDSVGAKPFTFAYSSGTLTATITPTAPLPADTYSLTVLATVTDVAAAKNLDGEIVGGVLPSGDGLPGGNAVVRFTVAGCNPCDLNCDGSVSLFDIQPFVDALSGASTPCSACAGDANADGTLNIFDIQPFVECLGG